MSGNGEDAPKVSLISLGCPKNLVDSEVLLGRLAQAGWAVSAESEGSDVLVINTCGFLQDGARESVDLLRQAVRLRNEGKVRGVVVAGCLPQRDPSEAGHLLAEADAILGVASRDHIVEVCDGLLHRRPPVEKVRVTTELPRYEIDRDRLRLTPRHYTYVRISEGCDHTCAFCVIPRIRGRFRSKPIEAVLDEVRELAAHGAREFNLIAQDTTSYGLDLYRRLALDELLDRVSGIDGVEWIRLLYAYPTVVTDRLIEAVARNPKVVKYIDLPIQHTRERMLRAMRRGMTEEGQRDLIRRLRESIPGLVLRTTVIVGFPGETEEEFEGLLADLEELRFDRLGAFVFSREPGSPAADLDGQVPDEVKEDRWHRVMRLQRRIARDVNRGWIGREIAAIVDRSARGGGIGRTYGDAPDVDGTIRLRAPSALTPGRIVRARVEGVRGYDLTATVVA